MLTDMNTTRPDVKRCQPQVLSGRCRHPIAVSLTGSSTRAQVQQTHTAPLDRATEKYAEASDSQPQSFCLRVRSS